MHPRQRDAGDLAFASKSLLFAVSAIPRIDRTRGIRQRKHVGPGSLMISRTEPASEVAAGSFALSVSGPQYTEPSSRPVTRRVGVRATAPKATALAGKASGPAGSSSRDHLRLAGRIQSDSVDRALEAAVVDCAEHGLCPLRIEVDG